MTTPRISPLAVEHWPEQIAPLAERMKDGPLGRVVNLFKTLAHHPRALKRYITFAHHLIDSSLSGRDREILILRLAWIARTEYEWGHHVIIGRREGLSEDEVANVQIGASAPWPDKERLLIKAVDGLHAESRVPDAVWSELCGYYDTAQMIDIVLTVGNYAMLGMALKSFGVPLDEGVPGFDRP